jgi:hypothetical protein
VRFYIVNNTNGQTPLIGVPYVHIKVKYDGSQTLVMTSEVLEGELELDLATAQTQVDGWISDENANIEATWQPSFDGEEIPLQSKISLTQYVNLAHLARWIVRSDS